MFLFMGIIIEKDNRFIGTTRIINPGTAKGFFGLFATIAVFDTSRR